MRIRNIEQVLVWRKDCGKVSTLAEIACELPIVPAGTLDYYDVVDVNVNAFQQSIKNENVDALGNKHRAVLNDVMRTLLRGELDEMTYLFVLSPNHRQFSPGLRADVKLEEIPDYWPGDEHVDVIGATWYVHGEHQRAAGMEIARSITERSSWTTRSTASTRRCASFAAITSRGTVRCRSASRAGASPSAFRRRARSR